MFDLPRRRPDHRYPPACANSASSISQNPNFPAISPKCAPSRANAQFNNCLHLEEPGCRIKQAVGEGTIAIDRYASYLSILASIEENNYH